ncbi:uncharacterized protein [Halyomorpha halys]|uniref:uncharacterized protein n=1 Tax=Halyomorpha halys TaxID=286706 RepID=UPI0006D4F2D7|nr:uncharacterized protein LOC106692846 [Halyomorpha halys]
MGEGSVRRMEALGFLVVLGLALWGLAVASDVQEVAVQQSVLDVYASSSQRSAFHGLDLYQGPVIVLANTSQQQDNGLVAYYADNGIRSIVDSKKFQPLYQLLRASPNVSGLVIGYQGLDDNSFLLKVVRDFVLPDNFKLYDLVRESVYTVPIVYVAPKGVFNNHSFVALDHVAKFVVDDFNIDEVPVNNSQFANHHLANLQVVLIPVFTQGYSHYNPGYNHYNPGYNPYNYQHSGSFPSKYQIPTFNPYGYHAPNNRGTSSFPFFGEGVEQGFNSIGHNHHYSNRYPHSFYPSNL